MKNITYERVMTSDSIDAPGRIIGILLSVTPSPRTKH